MNAKDLISEMFCVDSTLSSEEDEEEEEEGEGVSKKKVFSVQVHPDTIIQQICGHFRKNAIFYP